MSQASSQCSPSSIDIALDAANGLIIRLGSDDLAEAINVADEFQDVLKYLHDAASEDAALKKRFDRELFAKFLNLIGFRLIRTVKNDERSACLSEVR